MKSALIGICILTFASRISASSGEERSVFNLLVRAGVIEQGNGATILVENNRAVYVFLNYNKVLLRYAPDIAVKKKAVNPDLLLEKKWDLAKEVKSELNGSTYIMTPLEAQQIIYKIVSDGSFFVSPIAGSGEK